MGSLAAHMRIANIQVTNEDVDTRTSAVNELVKAWGKLQQLNDILKKSMQIAAALGGDGLPDADLAEEVQKVIQNHASAFLHSESPLEIGICAGVAMIQMLSAQPGDSGWTTPDIFAVSLWSALDFQHPLTEPKRESLRREVLNIAKNRAIEAADAARNRIDVADFPDLVINQGEDHQITTHNFKKITTNTINALRRNAALDREEIDFLWWIQLGRSRILNRPLNRIAEPVRLVAVGVEAAEHLRRLPAQVHRELVIRTLDEDQNLDLEHLIIAIGDDREAIANYHQSAAIKLFPSVFPLLHALQINSYALDGANCTRSSSAWGERALLEASLATLYVHGIGKL